MISKSTGLTLLEAHNFNRWAAKNPDKLLYKVSPKDMIQNHHLQSLKQYTEQLTPFEHVPHIFH